MLFFHTSVALTDNLFFFHNNVYVYGLVSAKHKKYLQPIQLLCFHPKSYIEQEGLCVRVTRSTSNRELLGLIESEMEGPKPDDEPEDVPGEEEEQPEETEERAERPRRRR